MAVIRHGLCSTICRAFETRITEKSFKLIPLTEHREKIDCKALSHSTSLEPAPSSLSLFGQGGEQTVICFLMPIL